VAADDSWLVVVVGDGQGGVAGIGRVALALEPAVGPARSSSRASARLALGPLRARLAGSARADQGVGGPVGAEADAAVVLPFRR
jgi:hypothetical protein